MTHLLEIYNLLEAFGTSHNMVSEFKLLNALDDLESMELSYRGMYVCLDDADISREDNNPVYDVRWNVVIVDKTEINNPKASILSNQENLFVIGQLQDYLIRESTGNQEFDTVSMKGFVSGDYNITSAVTSVSFSTGRKGYDVNIDS